MSTVAILYTIFTPTYFNEPQNAPFRTQYVELPPGLHDRLPIAGLGVYTAGEVQGNMRNYANNHFVFLKITDIENAGNDIIFSTEVVRISITPSSQIIDRLDAHRYTEFREGQEIVDILREIGVNPPDEWMKLLNGERPKPDKLNPEFFEVLKTTTDWKIFEDNTYYLLKVIGIHNLYKYHRSDQRGKSDGFFIFKNLAVVFDMTLEQNYQEPKREQIFNFCSQLQRGEIRHNNQIHRTGEKTKQVWIITKGADYQPLERVEDVSVKEIHINDLINLYRKRIIDNLNEEALENALKNIGAL